MTSLTYKTYASKVQQRIHGFVQGETAETWIKPKERNQDERLDYLSITDHYGGEGNKALRIKEAAALCTLLIYMNERAISFEKLLTNMQTIFTGLSENGDILNDP